MKKLFSDENSIHITDDYLPKEYGEVRLKKNLDASNKNLMDEFNNEKLELRPDYIAKIKRIEKEGEVKKNINLDDYF